MSMKYTIVNEKLRIASCCVSDLTMQQVESFLNQWEDGARIGELSLFYEKETDFLVINRDHPSYKEYLDIAENYLTADDAECVRINDAVPESLQETITVLHNCRMARKVKADIDIADYQALVGIAGTYEYSVFMALIQHIGGMGSVMNRLPLLLSYIFNYGMVTGKRVERARRKTV